MPPLLASALSLLAALSWCAILAASGRLLAHHLRLPLPALAPASPSGSGSDSTPTPFTLLALHLLLGAWLASALALLAGLLGLFHPPALLALAGTLALLSRRHLRRPPRFPIALLLPAALLLPLALATPFWYDALTYHLALPWQALLDGRIAAHPENLFSTFPPLAQLVYSYLLAAGLERSTGMVHLLLYLVSAGVLHELATALGARRRLSLLAAASLPLLAPHALVPAVAGAEGFLLLGVLVAAASILGRGPRHGFAPAGIALGVAMAARLQGLSWFLLLSAVLLLRDPARGALCLAIAAAGASLWWLKNALLLGEGFAPIGWDREGIDTLWRASGALLGQGVALHEVPLRLARELLPHAAYLAPLLLAALLALWQARTRERIELAALVSAGFLAWAATGVLPRFLAPTLALLLVLVAAAPGTRAAQLAATLALAGNLALGAAQTLGGLLRLGVLRAPLDSPAATCARQLQANPCPAFARAAERLPREARVLFVGEPRAYRFPRRFVVSSQHDVSPLPAEIAAPGGRFTHLLVNHAELARLAPDYPVAPFPGEGGGARLSAYLATLGPPVLAEGPVEIYALPGK